MEEVLCHIVISILAKYRNFIKNNELKFSREGIVVIYAPNGTGKTTLSNLLTTDKWKPGVSLHYNFNDLDYENDNSVFHVISDQNNRNIIAGETKDFLLGDDIAREFELKKYIDSKYIETLDKAVNELKDIGITTKTNPLIKLFSNDLRQIVKSLANKNAKGREIKIEEFLHKINAISDTSGIEYDEIKLAFFQKDFADKASLINMISEIAIDNMPHNNQVEEIEENEEAIRILEHFEKNQCIVCDSENIDRNTLISKKIQNKNDIYDALDKETKKIIESIIPLAKSNDPFDIKNNLLKAIANGDVSVLLKLKKEFDNYKNIFTSTASSKLKTVLLNNDLECKLKEYYKMLETKPEPTDEDIIYIEEIISNSMDKKLSVERDENTKNLKITLDGTDFIGEERGNLPLSTGEQNFLSLSFECLKAKNNNKAIIVLDDPISSFDSIYKNKVIYSIVKILENKQRIIFTHNLDLLRLLDGQFSYCYNFYLMNNTENEENGFISLTKVELKMLTNLKVLLDTFRESIFSNIKDVKRFLVAMIPFMRGYANIIGKNDVYEKLTALMHGYRTEKVDVAEMYRQLFGDTRGELEKDIQGVIPTTYVISVHDILDITVDGVEILSRTNYPLLDKTLKHSFTYLFLRLLVEKTLVNKFKIDTTIHEQLGAIIKAAFPNNDIESVRYRTRLTSKKTLLNEFNHFEGNLSIFQPAIDITNATLAKEKGEILTFVENIQSVENSDSIIATVLS